jgi:hypothetical protein
MSSSGGAPERAGVLVALVSGDRRLVVDAIGLAVAELLPPEYRGVYGDSERFNGAQDALLEARHTTG